MNTADSDEMSQPLRARGMTATASLKDADVVIMNTCTVREQAEHRAQSNIGRLKEWKAANDQRILIVAGCAASLWGDSIQKRFPFIDLVSPATKIEQFPEAVSKVLSERWNLPTDTADAFSGLTATTAFVDDLDAGSEAPKHPFLFGDDKTAYVTIMRGCNYSCSYCIVPTVRGRESYRPMADILREIQTKVAEGYEEVMLLGQTVNSYYDRTDASSGSPVRDFADLLAGVSAIDGVERIRFMSPHPRHMRDRVIDAMAATRKVCRHIHLPLQSGSDRLLSQMKRLYTRDQYADIVAKLRQAMPGILITTDLIVGYPGETPADFSDTLEFMERIRFEGLFAFKYSPRPGTVSAESIDDVSDDEKNDRLQTVLALNKKIQAELHA